MAYKIKFSTSNAQITDEVLKVTSSAAVKLFHDAFYNKTGKWFFISTAAGGGGTVLVSGLDYTIGGSFLDADLPISISPDVAYSTIAITNATYHNIDLYLRYYPLGDTWNADDTNIVRSVSTITTATDVTIQLPDARLEGQERVYKRRGAGSGVLKFTTISSQTIEGISASIWEIEAEGTIVLVPVDGNWEVKEYIDGFGDSSSTWTKYLTGEMHISQSMNGAVGGVLSNTLAHPTATADYRCSGSSNASTSTSDTSYKFTSKTTTTVNVVGTAAGGYTSAPCDTLIIARWRV